jgi:hypothetical protein
MKLENRTQSWIGTGGLLLVLSFVVLLSSCPSSGGPAAGESWKKTEVIDMDKVPATDTETGALFDILTGESTGMDFNNVVKTTYKSNIYYNTYVYNGGGVGIGDINNDGLPDIYMSGNFVDDKLYLNKGNLEFEDITEASGIGETEGHSRGVSMVDINSDGYLDIYVCRNWYREEGAKNDVLFINNGDNTFTESAEEWGLVFDAYTSQVNFFDYDNDGDLDMYAVTHPDDFNDKSKLKYFVKIENGQNMSDYMFRNDGDKFTDVSAEAGINNHGYGLSATIGDLNNDGWQDVYVANDFIMYDFMYLNNGDGTFDEVNKERLKRNSHFSMGSDLTDVNNDGLLDIYTVDMDLEDNYTVKTFMFVTEKEMFESLEEGGYHSQYVGNALHLNSGQEHFTEVARMSGIATSSWSWSPLFADYDLDGDRDLFISNGYGRDFHVDNTTGYARLRRATRIGDSAMYADLRDKYPTQPLISPNAIYENNGDLSFTDRRVDWGTYYPSATYGAACADLDNDGDIDIVGSNTNDPSFIYRNNADKLFPNRSWIKFDLKGAKGNMQGVGAWLEVRSNGNSQFYQQTLVRGYQSTMVVPAVFGLGEAQQADEVVITWPDGKRQRLQNVAANQLHVLDHANANEQIDIYNFNPAREVKPAFAAVNDLGIDFEHKENDFDDFDREYLIPHKLSYLGPGIAVADFNGDGIHDFAVGGAHEQSAAVYTQSNSGKFSSSAVAALGSDAKYEDMGMLAFDADGDGDQDLYACSGGSEWARGDAMYQDRLYINDGNGGFSKADGALPEMFSSTSSASASDFDGDGDLDLFVAGRLVPGQYPDAARSYLLRNDAGKFSDVTDELAPGLAEAGMIAAAQWSDYNGDGQSDLVLIGEWSPLMIFENKGGKLEQLTTTGIEEYTGWWNSLNAGDFDSDGDMDYVAGNFGINCKYKPDHNGPIEVFADDFDGNETNDILMGYYQNGILFPIKSRERVAEQCPVTFDAIKNWDEYGQTTLMDLFGEERMNSARTVANAKTFETMYFENLGNGQFQARKLNNQLQISSVYGMLVADVNRDGNLDLLTHGNYYYPEVETNRQDASVGQLLLGNGDGSFRVVNSRESGFFSPLDAKALVWIGQANGEAVVLGSNNNGPMVSFKHIEAGSTVWAAGGDVWGEIEHRDGSKTRLEFPAGSSYLSTSAHPVIVPTDARKVTVYNQAGESRTIWPSLSASR